MSVSRDLSLHPKVVERLEQQIGDARGREEKRNGIVKLTSADKVLSRGSISYSSRYTSFHPVLERATSCVTRLWRVGERGERKE
jgi:hypothetical protein